MLSLDTGRSVFSVSGLVVTEGHTLLGPLRCVRELHKEIFFFPDGEPQDRHLHKVLLSHSFESLCLFFLGWFTGSSSSWLFICLRFEQC